MFAYKPPRRRQGWQIAIGVPLTLFRLAAEDRYAVVEMGANHPGEINYLARIAQLPGTPEVLLNIEPHCADGLDDARRATVYRILREAVNNVLRHARASRLEIDCHRGANGMTLVVDDNGDGQLPLAEGRGINGIRYRAAEMGGRASWSASRFSSGVRFSLTLPATSHG